jgi:hypothetical protein
MDASSIAGRSSSLTARLSTGSAGISLPEEPITLYRIELERLQHILHFPEEVAFQVYYSFTFSYFVSLYPTGIYALYAPL